MSRPQHHLVCPCDLQVQVRSWLWTIQEAPAIARHEFFREFLGMPTFNPVAAADVDQNYFDLLDVCDGDKESGSHCGTPPGIAIEGIGDPGRSQGYSEPPDVAAAAGTLTEHTSALVTSPTGAVAVHQHRQPNCSPWSGTSIDDFKFLDARREWRNMSRNCNTTHRMFVRGRNYMRDHKKVR